MLTSSQARHCRRISGVAHQVIATDTLDGDNSSGPELVQRGVQSRFLYGTGCLPATFEFQLRATGRARNGFCVKTAVAGIGVLGQAFSAELEARHAGVRTIVGQIVYQRVARTALSAVNERVLIAAITGIILFCRAIRAQKIIRRYEYSCRVAASTTPDFEFVEGDITDYDTCVEACKGI